MCQTPEEPIPVNKHDEQNIRNLLEGHQIEMLRGFCTLRNRDQIKNTGVIYYLFSQYWPHELAQELRVRSGGLDPKMADDHVIEQSKPLHFFSNGEYDWEGISRTISILDAVRVKIIEQKNPLKSRKSLLVTPKASK